MSWRESLQNTDARLWQIGALGTLLLLSNLWSDFGSSPVSLACAILGTMSAEAVAARVRGTAFDWRSPLITGFSLALLLRAPQPGWYCLAGMLAITSKSVLRWRGKHLFNPANFAIVVSLLANRQVWITPGQWGSGGWLVALLIALGALVLGRAGRIDTALAFLATWAAGLCARAAWLGDPLAIPLHQLGTGALVIFACFMITDPRSTPDHRAGRIVLAVSVALLGLAWQIQYQLIGAPLYALAALAWLTPVLDRLFRRERFTWRRNGGFGNEAVV